MTALDRKLLRDLYYLRGQMIAVSLVVACGVAVFLTTRTAYDSLLLSQASYYSDFRFPDIFATLKRAPETLAGRIAALPGVGAVQTRIVFDVTLDVPGLQEPATGRLVSIPEHHAPVLNDLYLRRGRYIEPGRRDEVLVGEAFALANHLDIGDRIGAILNGRWQQLTVVGIVLCPEYVYEIRGSDIFPDNRRFGVLWMSRDAMGPAFDLDGAFNDVVLSLAPGASETDVISHLDRLLEPYGGLGAYGRADQISNRFLSDEIAQNRVTGTILPAIFLGVAAFLINIVLSRLVSMQREQIAVLKAFGYTHLRIALHYLEFAAVVTAGGGVLGTGVGLWLGYLVNRMYVQFYRFPVLRFEVGLSAVGLSLAIAGGAALLGALAAVRRALLLPPAEAMRPEPPARFRSSRLDVLLLRYMPSPLRMISRNIARRPIRATLSILGIGSGVAILLVGRYFVDAVQYIADVQFRLVHRDSVTVAFHNPLPPRVQHELARLPGVLRAEPYRTVPVRLRFEHRDHLTSLVGLEPSTQLHKLVDARLRQLEVPPDGVLLTTKLAEILGVTRGDTIRVEVLEGERARRAVTVAGTVDELVGLSAYIDNRELAHLMRDGGVASGAFLAVEPSAATGLYTELKRMPVVGGIAIREAALRSFEETVARNMGIFTTVLVVFSTLIAIAIVYNATRVALSERARELASLRVLGFTRQEVSFMLLGEQAILTLIAIPVGFLIGYRICAVVARQYQWELFRLPLYISQRSYGITLLTILAAAVGSALLVRRRLDRLDLVEALKTRE